MLICLTIIDIFSIFIFFKTKKERTLRTKNENYLEKVKKFILEENSFIAESYKFSKNNRSQSENKDSDYFPLPIIDIKQEKNINVNLVDLCSEIESYFDCYSEYIGNNNIKLEFDCEKSAKALVPFEKEVLKQIIISIIVNLLNFSRKSNDPRTITISANDSTFAFISNGFKLNKQIAVTASQRIFFDSLNPFILNFSQIIGLLNKHDLDITIDYDNQFSFIKMDFLQKVISIDEKNIGKVINFKSYGKRI